MSFDLMFIFSKLQTFMKSSFFLSLFYYVCKGNSELTIRKKDSNSTFSSVVKKRFRIVTKINLRKQSEIFNSQQGHFDCIDKSCSLERLLTNCKEKFEINKQTIK